MLGKLFLCPWRLEDIYNVCNRLSVEIPTLIISQKNRKWRSWSGTFSIGNECYFLPRVHLLLIKVNYVTNYWCRSAFVAISYRFVCVISNCSYIIGENKTDLLRGKWVWSWGNCWNMVLAFKRKGVIMKLYLQKPRISKLLLI